MVKRFTATNILLKETLNFALDQISSILKRNPVFYGCFKNGVSSNTRVFQITLRGGGGGGGSKKFAGGGGFFFF